MREARFAFGKSGIRFDLPDGPKYELVEGRAAPALADVQAALNQALDQPIAGPPLLELARGKSSAAISVCDITRPAPNAVTLPPILKRLQEAGIPAGAITILVATGLHRGATEEEIRVIVGSEIAANYRVVNHDARAIAEQRHLGNTGRGTPVYIDERFMSADLHLTLGFIEPHLMLGFSGGRKLVAPGVAGEQTIKVIHSPRFMREPAATEGSITENPLHAELLEIAAMAGHHFMLDVTLTPEREISGIFAGRPVEAHRAGVAFLTKNSLVDLGGRADVVITSAAGYPLDLTFYQAIKGVTAAEHLVKPGGTILMIAECSEGAGSPEFAEKLASFKGYSGFLSEIEQAPVVVDQWQLEKLALIGLRANLLFYTPKIPKVQMGALGERSFSDLPDAVAHAVGGLDAESRVALVPEGPYVYAR